MEKKTVGIEHAAGWSINYRLVSAVMVTLLSQQTKSRLMAHDFPHQKKKVDVHLKPYIFVLD